MPTQGKHTLSLEDLALLFLPRQEAVVGGESGSWSFLLPVDDASFLTQAALNMLTMCQALTYKEAGILCVALHPGWVKTDMGTQEVSSGQAGEQVAPKATNLHRRPRWLSGGRIHVKMSCLSSSKLPMSVLVPCRTCGYCLGSGISTYQAGCSGGKGGLWAAWKMCRESESNRAGRRGATPSHPVPHFLKNCRSMKFPLILQDPCFAVKWSLQHWSFEKATQSRSFAAGIPSCSVKPVRGFLTQATSIQASSADTQPSSHTVDTSQLPWLSAHSGWKEPCS